jgi:hypothetical protein
MSLINDALRRATLSRTLPPPLLHHDPALQTVHPRARNHVSAVYLSIALLGLLIGGSLLFRGWKAVERIEESTLAQIVAAAESTTPIVRARSQPTPAPPTDDLLVAEGTNASADSNSFQSSFSEPRSFANSGAVPFAVEPPPPLRLQGIFYRTRNPSAMISSELVYVGDEVQNARVLSIGRESVTVKLDGETLRLNLP